MCGGADGTNELKHPLELPLPSTTFMTPAAMSEDDIAEWMQGHQDLVSIQAAQALSLSAPDRDEGSLTAELPLIVARCAGLCHFHAIQQSGASAAKGHKFLLLANPPASSGATIMPGQQ